MSEGITLHELNQKLREEITIPLDTDTVPLFLIEGAEIEVSISIEKSANAGLKIWAIGDVEGGQKKQANGKITLKLQPIVPREEHIAELKRTGKWVEIFEASKKYTRKRLGG